jgi:hypothetical protein
MRHTALAALAALLIAASSAGAAPTSTAPALERGSVSMLELVAAKKKETISQKVKRVWRSWTDHQFCVRCPIILPITSATCSVKRGLTGPSRDEARATCVNRNPLCTVNEGAC